MSHRSSNSVWWMPEVFEEKCPRVQVCQMIEHLLCVLLHEMDWMLSPASSLGYFDTLPISRLSSDEDSGKPLGISGSGVVCAGQQPGKMAGFAVPSPSRTWLPPSVSQDQAKCHQAEQWRSQGSWQSNGACCQSLTDNSDMSGALQVDMGACSSCRPCHCGQTLALDGKSSRWNE